MAFKSITDDQFAAADKIVKEDGRPVTEAARETGISAQTLYKRYRPSTDPRPGGRRRVTAKPGPTDEQLVSLFTKGAIAPAIPAGIWLRCDFCAAHFVTQGPKAAEQLVELSKDNPQLRKLMEAIWRQWETVAWSAILVTWLGVPIAHHAAPDWIYKWLQLPLSLPPRGTVAGPPPHAHPHTNGNGAAPNEPVAAPMSTPFGNLDMETLISMAQSMGLQVPDFAPPVQDVTEPIGDDAATTEVASDTETADDAASAEVAPVETDSHADE